MGSISTTSYIKKVALLFVVGVIAALALTVMNIARVTFLHHEVVQMKKEIDKMKMKTVCVGRFLLDVPDDAVVEYLPAFLAGWTITAEVGESKETFFAKVKEREAGLKAQKNMKGQPSLELALPVEANGVVGKVFVFGREWDYGIEGGKKVETNFVAMDALVRAGENSYFFTAPILHDDDAKELAQIISQLRARLDSDIPQESGFCFNRGVVLDPLAAKQNESLKVSIRLESHPDLSIALSTTAGLTSSKSLVERTKESSVVFSLADQLRFHSFRQGPRAINGIKGEEVLERVDEHNGTSGHNFMWETVHNDKFSVLTPLVLLEMSTGDGGPNNPVKASVSDAEALALWEKISSSLRLRLTR